jgi:probable HAF family extracellular repeat protein
MSLKCVGQTTDTNGMGWAFVWKNGRMENLGALPGGSNSKAYAVNNRGHIAGLAERGEACDISRLPRMRSCSPTVCYGRCQCRQWLHQHRL